MAAEGRTVIFISHKLHEVKAVSDRVTVLRGGRRDRDGADTPASRRRSLASLMVGHELESGLSAASTLDGAARPVLELEDLWVDGDRGAAGGAAASSLSLRAGEIVAVAGVAGNGQRELARGDHGPAPATRGSIRLAGRPLPSGDARGAFDAGVGYVPEDRLGTGVAPRLSIAMNVELRTYRRCSLGPLLRLGRMREDADAAIRAYDIKAPGAGDDDRRTSRAATSRSSCSRASSVGRLEVLVAASPTRGLDVAAVEAVHAHLLEAADRGTAVLLISEDLDELLTLGDRILVMYEGELHEVADRENLQEIGLLHGGRCAEPALAGAAA